MMILPNGYWTISALQLAIYPGAPDLSARKSAPQGDFDVGDGQPKDRAIAENLGGGGRGYRWKTTIG
jgi:hypothetical protein